MHLIDTHGHLNLEPLAADWEAALERSGQQGISAVVMPGTDLETSRRAVELARARPGALWAGVGVHPTYLSDKRIAKSEWEKFTGLAKKSEVVAIGEVGLDSYRLQVKNSKFKNQNDKAKVKIDEIIQSQELVLRRFIELAQEVNKPLILHCRGNKNPVGSSRKSVVRSQNGPHERLIKILSDIQGDQRPQFVVHCYQGTVDQAERYLALGGFISFTGSITYSDDPAVAAVVRAVPLKRLMIETDSPFLSPAPYRGEINEPWKVVFVARRIAELKSLSVEEVATRTTRNAIEFFHLEALSPIP